MSDYAEHVWRAPERAGFVRPWLYRVLFGLGVISTVILISWRALDLYAARPFSPPGATTCAAIAPQPTMRWYDDDRECWRVWPGSRASLPPAVRLYVEVVNLPPVTLGPLVLNNPDRRVDPMAVNLLMAPHCGTYVAWRGALHEQWQALNPCPRPAPTPEAAP